MKGFWHYVWRGNYDCTDGRQLDCAECRRTHQHGHYNYYYDNNNNNNNNNHGCADFYNVNVNHHDNGCTDYYNVNVNNFDDDNGCTDDYNVNVNNNVNHHDDGCPNYYVDNVAAHGSATAHDQCIRQQFVCVKRCAKTAAQQTWIAVARWRFGVVRCLPRVQRPQSPQPAYGQAFANCVHLSLNPCSGASGHPKRPVCAIGPGANLHR